MTYNTTNMTGANNIVELAAAMNQQTGSVLFVFFLMFFWIILFSLLRNLQGTSNSLRTSSFVIAVAATGFLVAGLITGQMLGIVGTILAALVFISFMVNN